MIEKSKYWMKVQPMKVSIVKYRLTLCLMLQYECPSFNHSSPCIVSNRKKNMNNPVSTILLRNMQLRNIAISFRCNIEKKISRMQSIIVMKYKILMQSKNATSCNCTWELKSCTKLIAICAVILTYDSELSSESAVFAVIPELMVKK